MKLCNGCKIGNQTNLNSGDNANLQKKSGLDDGLVVLKISSVSRRGTFQAVFSQYAVLFINTGGWQSQIINTLHLWNMLSTNHTTSTVVVSPAVVAPPRVHGSVVERQVHHGHETNTGGWTHPLAAVLDSFSCWPTALCYLSPFLCSYHVWLKHHYCFFVGIVSAG